MHFASKLTKLKTSLLSTTPVITSSLKVNEVAQRMNSAHLIILVVQTVLEINTDMDVWRWFKCRDYQQGKLGVEAVVIGQKLKLLGGPKHVSVIYEALKASMGSGIQDLEFLVVLDVWDCGLVFSFWKIDGGMLRVYSHYKTKKIYSMLTPAMVSTPHMQTRGYITLIGNEASLSLEVKRKSINLNMKYL